MRKILMTGVSGYVGGLLAEQLLNRGHQIHAVSRNPSRIKLRHPALRIFEADLRNTESLTPALEGCDSAVYLAHSLDVASFEHEEASAASSFTEALNRSGCDRVIYLGGLGKGDSLSPHLRSRQLTGRILRLGKVPVLEFRASIVLGAGSASYQILKALVSRLPFFIDAPNLSGLCQPIAEADLLAYLIQGMENSQSGPSRIVEIGGADRVTYSELLARVADHSGIERRVISVPDLDPRLLSEAFELICPEQSRLGKSLLESLPFATVVENPASSEEFSGIIPIGIQDALEGIGRIESDLKSLFSRAHTLRILKSLGARFPKSRLSEAILGKIAVW